MPSGDELPGDGVGDRGEQEARLADELRLDTAGTERDERPKDGILDETGE